MRAGAIGIALLVIVLVCAACAPAEATAPPVATVDDALLAPDFTATSLSGDSYTLSALRGRWVIVNFWATWCVPCVTEMPALQQIADEHADTVVLLGVNVRESADEVAAFVAEHDLRFPILVSPDDSTLIDYQVLGVPQTVLIAPSGEIVYRQFGPVEVEGFGAELETRLGSEV
ncbi:MAG: TlpA family protein disulfide reductase [Anaerolineae bacterium]|nr:TlpA family protein disulfide reductase [Anaerolineae bacterium]